MSDFFERPPAADQTLIGRMIRAARLDLRLYAEVEADETSIGQAASVVLLAAFAGGINIPNAPFVILFGGLLAALAGWVLFAYVIYLIGAKLLPEPTTKADFGALLRAMGFANAPGVVKLLGIVPELRMFVFFVAMVWVLVATVTAVRHALAYKSSWRAIGVCAIPLLASQLLIFAVAYSITGSPEMHQGMPEPPVVLP
ncbi:MAG: YIP1 family protein [Deltaproteobacteria bacterium]|nr:YIP1 family protein [Deltaproteobacteria bacterium]